MLDILIFGAHPDDAEIGMGATIYKHTQAGLKVGICDLTLAEMSSNGTVELRQQEANAATEILGLSYRSNLQLPDRGLSMSPEHIQPIVAEIRRCKPRLVFAPYWEDRHPDHIQCSRMVQEAVFNAKLRKYMPDQEPHLVEELYYYFLNQVGVPDVVIDVSEIHPIKIQALSAYRSQFMDASSGQDIVPTVLNQGYLEHVEARDRATGQLRQVAYAEGFVSRSPVLLSLFHTKQ